MQPVVTPEQSEIIETRKNIVTGFLEAWWCLVEYFFIIITFSSIIHHGLWSEKPLPILDICLMGDDRNLSSVFDFLKCVVTNDYPAILIAITKIIIKLSVICVLMFVRYGNLWYDNATRYLPFRLGLNSFKIRGKFVFGVIAFQIIDMALMVLVREHFGKQLYSFSNYLTPDGKSIDYVRTLTMIVLSPIQEEIVFRGILFYLFYKRYPSKIFGVFMSNFFFGAFHLVNFFSSSYSRVYVLLQLAMGTFIGFVYGCRFLISGSIWEPIALHIINNLISSLMPIQSSLDLTDPWIFLPLLQTATFYSFLLYICKKDFEGSVQESKLDKLD